MVSSNNNNNIDNVTNDMSILENMDAIMITIPAQHRFSYLQEIKKYINHFNYDVILADLSLEKLIEMFEQEENDYCKLLILRAYVEQSNEARNRLISSDDILRKFVDETYHIENDYVYSLDIRKFNIVPQYYIEAAKKFVENEKINFKK